MDSVLFHYSDHRDRVSEPMYFVPVGDSPSPGQRLSGVVKTPPLKDEQLKIDGIKLELVAEYWFLRKPANGRAEWRRQVMCC